MVPGNLDHILLGPLSAQRLVKEIAQSRVQQLGPGLGSDGPRNHADKDGWGKENGEQRDDGGRY
jgi:hypothetical protein